ncbi:tetratricopeptide repeat protein, partial [bacterium]|nr:tetratricopeptide repeat protein [bacterium]
MKTRFLILIALLISFGMPCFAQAQNPDKNELAKMNYQKAFDSFKKGNTADTIMYLNKSIENKPTVQAYVELGKIYSKQNQYQKAIDAYTKAIEINPKYINAYIQRAKVCGDIEDYQCSLKDYETLKKLDPTNAEYYHASSLYKTNLKDF